MLGSHNSGSFLKQVGWTRWIPGALSRCQSIGFHEQYDLGVRFFDIRVTYYRGKYILAHGLAMYDMTLDEAMKIIAGFSDKCIVGIILEDTFFEFKGDVNYIIRITKDMDIAYITSKRTGQNYMQPKSYSILWAIPTARRFDILVPKHDCRDINRLFRKSSVLKAENIILFDFVETL